MKNKYEKLRKNLPRHFTRDFAKKIGKSRALIDKVLRGETDDHHGIINAAITAAEQEKKRKNEEKKKISKL